MTARRRLSSALAAFAAAALASRSPADVTYDSSSAGDAPLRSGPAWFIQESHGVQRGANLFHGFEHFSLARGETAVFDPTSPLIRDPTLPPIRHVIARVSGGVPSSIRGTILSRHENADLFLLNPAGVIFGPGALLQVNGDFTGSTAHRLRLGSPGVELRLDHADPFPERAVDAPGALGFLPGEPTGTLRIADTRLGYVPAGRTLGLIGGALEVESALVTAAAADLFAGAVHSGEIGIRYDAAGGAHFDASGVVAGGPIALREAALSTSGVEPDDGGGRWPRGPIRATPGAGDLFIRGGDLVATDANLLASTVGSLDGGDIDIDLDGRLALAREAIHGAGIFAFSQLPGSPIPQGPGSSGDIRIRARELSLSGGAWISTAAYGAGSAGRIDVDVRERVFLSGRDVDNGSAFADRSGFFVTTSGGPTGELRLRAQELEMDDYAALVGETRSAATGGLIELEVARLVLRGNARIDSSTSGPGDAGDIHVRASESILISGSESAEEFSGISALAQPARPGNPPATGAPGSIRIETPLLEIEGGGQITTGALGELSGDPEQDARRGDLEVDLLGDGRLVLGEGSALGVRSEGPRAAGDLRVHGAASIELHSGASISSAGDVGRASDGGNIELTARDRLELTDAEISASVGGGTGGNIRIDPDFVILRNGRIVAQAGSGSGGNIDITAGFFVPDAESVVDASSESGVDGTVVIRSPDVELTGDLEALPDAFVDPADRLAERCGARAAQARGRMTIRGLDALPDWPGQLRASRYATRLGDGADPELRELWSAAGAAEQRGDLALALERWEQAQTRSPTATLRAAAALSAVQALEHSGRPALAVARLDAIAADLDTASESVAAAALALRARLSAHGSSTTSDFERALRRAEGARDPGLEARIHADLAIARARSGELDAALAALDEAERAAERAGDPALELALRANRISLWIEAGEKARASEALGALQAALQRAPDTHDVDFAALHAELGALQLGSSGAQLHERLETLAARAARRGDLRAGSFALGLAARWLAQQGQSDAALASARRALLLAQRARSPEAELFASRILGDELAARGEPAAAVRAFEAAWSLRAGHFAAIADSATAAAANAAWFDRAALLDALVDALLRSAAQTEDPAQREQALLAARDHLDDRTALALREYFADECMASERVVSAATLPGALVAYPVLLPDRVELIVSSARGIRSVLVNATTTEIEADAQRLVELSQERTSRRYRAPAARLYDWLVRPLEAELESDGASTLVVVPRGALLRVPWAALYDERRRSHLIERYALAILPGLSLAESRPVSGDVEALKAGLSESVQGQPALPAVVREIDAVSSLYAGPTLLDRGFTTARLESMLRAAPYGVVHIASHARFGASARDAYVLTYDGKLGAERLAELMELTRFRDRPLELLTLSACDTSVGDERAALGLAGMALRAGARSTLGTLWPVQDEAAAELVGRFYRELSRPGGSRAGALRRAQTAALAEPRLDHPAYWSPFVMIGSWL